MKRIKLFAQNIKCGGCANQITTKLNKIQGVSSTQVNENEGSVEFYCSEESDVIEDVRSTLKKMGYPATVEENNILLQSKSYLSCAIGRVKKAEE